MRVAISADEGESGRSEKARIGLLQKSELISPPPFRRVLPGGGDPSHRSTVSALRWLCAEKQPIVTGVWQPRGNCFVPTSEVAGSKCISRMLFRVRFPNGETVRINCGDEADLHSQIVALDKIGEPVSLYSDVKFETPFRASVAANGDFVYAKGNVIVDVEAEEAAEATWKAKIEARNVAEAAKKFAADEKSRATAAEEDRGAAAPDSGERPEEDAERQAPCLPHCRRPNGMCEHCMPAEDKRGRYKRELEKWKGKGMSVAVMEALEALKFKVKPQEEAHIAAASVDSGAAAAFQAYLAKTGFSQQRVGVCYGRYSREDKETRVEAVYEPPQRGSADTYDVLGGDAAGDISERAGKLAGILGLREVGIVFSARERKCILSAKDVVFAAQRMSRLSPRARKDFVVLLVGVEESGETSFEAYQISDLAVEMYSAGIFEDVGKQRENGGRIHTTEDVLVEGKDTRKIPTEFFLLNIPIKSMESFLRVSFPVENRELQPQGPGDVRSCVAESEDLTYGKRLADFHLLLFLSSFFDMATDMPGLAGGVRDGKDEVEEGYRLMIDSMAAS